MRLLSRVPAPVGRPVPRTSKRTLDHGGRRPTSRNISASRKPVLVGYDPRLRDRAPVDFGAAAARLTGAPLIIAAVQFGRGGWERQPDADLLGDAGEALAALEAELGPDAPPVEFRKLEGSSAARALHEEAERESAAVLVVGSSRRSPAERVLGSTAMRLLHGSPCPVAVVPQGWTGSGLKTIGVGYAESDESQEALRAAHALAKRVGAGVRVITAVRHTEAMHLEVETYVAGQAGRSLEDVEGEHRLQAERRLRELVAQLGEDVPIEIDATVGEPAEVLIAISEHLDLLVCGSRAYGPLRAVLLGSVTRRVVAEARCPAVVLPRGVRAPLDALTGEQLDERAPAAY
jgi:nucleotide-binding universal stress UspA family protein